MCGICGMILDGEKPINQVMLHTMTDLMLHRGPDDDGYLVDGNIALGFRRLAIVDLEHGHQPMSNEDATVWVVFNGEIYNHESLRKDLIARGHVFQSNADTEVIVHLYEEQGIDCVKSLNGMFAIAIVDLRRRELYLARDCFGIKPLYYTRTTEGLLFASELRSLFAVQLGGPVVNMQAVWDYFTFQYVPSPISVAAGIEKLPPAHYLHYQDGNFSLHVYWSPEFHPDHSKPLSYFVEGTQYHLTRSVRGHLQGGVPVGAFLSSGIDSSAIAALANRHQSLKTFSVGFDSNARSSVDELGHASEMANWLGTEHKSVTVSSKDFMERLPHVLYSLEEPLGDPSAVALYFVAELASASVTAVLSGEGADEIFGGYPIYHEPTSLKMFQYLPSWFRTTLRGFAQKLPYGLKGRNFLIRGSTPVERRFIGNIQVFNEEAKRELFDPLTFEQEILPSFHVTDSVYARSAGLDDMTRMQLVDLNAWLPNDILLKADKMSMAHSLELRVPFLDRELFEFASTIPVKYLIHHKQGKFVLRQAMRDLLPEQVVTRPKLGFPVPYRQMMRDMSDFVWDVYQSSSVRYWFHTERVATMIRHHRDGSRDYGRELWTLLAFLLWYRVFLEHPSMKRSRLSPSVALRRDRIAQLHQS